MHTIQSSLYFCTIKIKSKYYDLAIGKASYSKILRGYTLAI